MPRVVIVNAFSPTMLDLKPGKESVVIFREASINEVKKLLSLYRNDVECAIGHVGTARLVGELLVDAVGELKCERKMVTGLKERDVLVIVVLGFRIPEGKVYTYEEMLELLKQGKVKFYLATVIKEWGS